jgi:ABC-type polysaccharide/polyol phosphate transport system ATPase subunit
MIRVRKVCKDYQTSFGANHVLRDVSFDLRKGEKLGILGRNGAGKSTLMRLVSGAEMPSSGTIDRSMSVSWPLAFGGAFQTMLTGRDNVRFISRIYDQDFERNLAFVEDFAELGPYLHEPVRTYSSGMRARLAFAISMITEFDCFLIDEVGAVGDARFHERCNHELFVRRADRAMIIISHDAAYLRDHCTRFAVLHDARLRQMTDFDEAYGEFRRLVGLAPDRQPVARVPIDRTRLIEASQTRALRDERFTLLVQDGDMHRDARRWPQAEAAYAEALALYPYQRSYWVQHAPRGEGAGPFRPGRGVLPQRLRAGRAAARRARASGIRRRAAGGQPRRLAAARLCSGQRRRPDPCAQRPHAVCRAAVGHGRGRGRAGA